MKGIKVNLTNVKVYICLHDGTPVRQLSPPGIINIDEQGQPVYMGGLYECLVCKKHYQAHNGRLEEVKD